MPVIKGNHDNPTTTAHGDGQTLAMAASSSDDLRCAALSLLKLRACSHVALTPVSPEAVITIPDKNLETAIREAVGGEITAAKLAQLTTLELRGLGITDLSGLGFATNLTSLHMIENQISDLTPLAFLTNLTRLLASDNEISDVSALASLTNLTSLWLEQNPLSDISPLESLTNLDRLQLQLTQIRDLSALASLSSLTTLDLEWNDLSDISPLVQNSGLGTGDEIFLRSPTWMYRKGRQHWRTLSDYRRGERRFTTRAAEAGTMKTSLSGALLVVPLLILSACAGSPKRTPEERVLAVYEAVAAQDTEAFIAFLVAEMRKQARVGLARLDRLPAMSYLGSRLPSTT